MKLLTNEIRERLLANGREPDRDRPPVLKVFNPSGGQTWLIVEADPEEPDILFGLCDLGHGFPELGSVRLSELEAVRGRCGLPLERDIHFVGKYPISVYTRAAQAHGGIVENEEALRQAAAGS
jgi:DUF2958 family protein